MPVAARIAMFGLSMGLATTAGPVRAQSEAELDKAASEMSAAIQKSAGGKGARVLVLDFAGPKGQLTELGVRLADEISGLLAKQSGITLVDRQLLHDAVVRDKVTEADLERADAPMCYADELKAGTVVTGRLKASSADFELELAAASAKDHDKKLFEEKVRGRLTDEEKALADARVVFSTRVQPGELSPDPTIPAGGARGYSMPACINCPSPQPSKEAVRAKYEGTVLMMAQVDPDGHASHLLLVRGVGCGLNEKAMETVSKWRFKPAIGPDGLPVAVKVPVEVSFRLY